jgi:dTDP-4-dehydrorhamnose reductase
VVATAQGVAVTTWLVTGGTGQLGSEVVALLAGRGDTVAAPTTAELDITDASAVRAFVDATRPDMVVNCAAYTAVDAAESEVAEAAALNADAPRHLALACAQAGARMLQVSTDYVFAGDTHEPYAEDAPTGPRTVYGRTKLAGEAAVLEVLPDSAYVVRTAWLYGPTGSNFVRTMLRLAAERATVDVVDDQQGQPTSATDLAARLVELAVGSAPPGVYHGTNAGSTTWHGFAREVFRLSGLDPERVRTASSADVVRPAQRPAYSVLGHDRWALAGLGPMRPWQDALAAALPFD